jgi:hypothetical protein
MHIKVLVAAAIIALLAGPVLAQQQAPMQRYGEKDKEKTPNELEQERAAQRAYQRSLGTVPDKAPVDPWGNARGVEAPKGGVKGETKHVTAKPKAKAGGASN